MGTRRIGREIALQMLYAVDSNPAEEHPVMPQEQEDGTVNYEALDFADELFRGVMENRPRIDELIVAKSKNWSLSRMARVDLNIMRIAVYELLFCSDTPRSVTINEAIEVTKKYGTSDSPAFVNGILDEIVVEK